MHFSISVIALSLLGAAQATASELSSERSAPIGPWFDITSPHAGNTWMSGKSYEVTWSWAKVSPPFLFSGRHCNVVAETRLLAQNATQRNLPHETGRIYLGSGYNNSMLLEYQLAKGVSIYGKGAKGKNSFKVTIPKDTTKYPTEFW